MVFVAHYASTPLPMLMEMPAAELVEWHNAAVGLWNKLHPSADS